jgi:cation:H+ antiporter
MQGAESAWSILWTAPAILLASLMIAWAAESAQFFMAQGFALVILAWMQTLPEFAVEAVLAWHGQTHLLIANLSGAIRLLTGLGWPLIYGAAAFSYRRKYGRPMQEILLDPHQSTSVVGVFVCLIYVAVIAAKGSLGLIDAAVLIAIYAVYLYVIRQLPAENSEDIAHLEGVPRAIVKARRPLRIAAIFGLFIAGGATIVFVADPFVASMAAISTTLGISQFIFIQWVAPFISEFPEGVSAFYWARGITDAPMALMNMVSSNITQWALLAALLPVVLSLGAGHPSVIVFDRLQEIELLMTLGQSLVGMLFLISMKLEWWEGGFIFVMWTVQLGASVVLPSSTTFREAITVIYFAGAAVEFVRLLAGRRKPEAFRHSAQMWKDHVRP